MNRSAPRLIFTTGLEYLNLDFCQMGKCKNWYAIMPIMGATEQFFVVKHVAHHKTETPVGGDQF